MQAIVPGILVGLVAFVACSRFVSSLLFEVSPVDRVSPAGAALALSVRASVKVAEVLRQARHFDEAIVQARRALQLNPNFGAAHLILGHCYLGQGKWDTAIEEYQRSGLTGGNLGHAYAVAGRTLEARHLLAALEARYASTSGGAGEIAQVYVGLGEFDRAFEWLSRAVEDGSVWTFKVAVVWDPLRSDPRFEHLVRKSGLGD
jgi:tetratricopeptide (TPR) repeat protein